MLSSTPGPHTVAPPSTIECFPAGKPLRDTNNPNGPNGGRVTAAIPAAIIQSICEELGCVWREDARPEIPQQPIIALQMYLKNRDIRAVSHVCKNWMLHTTTFMCLWRNIAFDVAEPKSIRLAASFLSLVEGEDVPLRIYAGFGHSNLPDPELVKLLSDLRRNTGRWSVFEYQGSLGEYSSYLDLPAPNLRYFSDHGDSSRNTRQIFAGHAPSLRHLFTWSTRDWDSTIFSNLTEFHFGRPGCGPSPSLNSLLDLFRNAPGLETLRLKWIGSFIYDCATDATVSLPCLRTLEAHNTDFDDLAEHISTPNVQEMTFMADTPTHPSFQAPHALTGLSSISILDRSIYEVTVVIAHTIEGGTFRIHLMAHGGSSFDVCLIWDTGIIRHWKSYVTETLSVLAERIRLDPGAVLHLYLGIRWTSSWGAFMIHGGFARGIFRAIADAEVSPVIFPPLTCGLLITNSAPALDEDETQMLRLCLRSRATCKAGLFIRLKHGGFPWLCTADSECPDECGNSRCDHFLQFEFHPLEDDCAHGCRAHCPFLVAVGRSSLA